MTIPLRPQPSVPPWLAWCLIEFAKNIKEKAGNEHHQRILEYHKHTTLKATTDEVSWCSAALCCCFDEIGIGGTGSAAARSWINFGVRLKEFRLGAVAVLDRHDANNPLAAHVGVALCEDETTITLVSGNHNNQWTIAKFPKSKLIGYFWPEHEPEEYVRG
jgi:uncharacterized protein (TIGR02594 family)